MGLEGTWYNELGSTLVVEQITDGTIVGSYQTAVSSTGCAQGAYPLLGKSDIDSGGQTVGFSVTWLNPVPPLCNSTTSWAGQYQLVDGVERFSAIWILVKKTDPEDEWADTLVGEDLFTREPPEAEHMAAGGARRRPAHP
jgi:Avidin family